MDSRAQEAKRNACRHDVRLDDWHLGKEAGTAVHAGRTAADGQADEQAGGHAGPQASGQARACGQPGWKVGSQKGRRARMQ